MIGTGNHWILDVAVGWAVVIVAMWLVDPWFLQGNGTPVLVEFHDRLAAEASSPPIVLEAEREPEPMAGADREQPQGCRRRYDTDG